MAGLNNPQPGDWAVFLDYGRAEVRQIRSATPKTLVLEPRPGANYKRKRDGERRLITVALVAVLAEPEQAENLRDELNAAVRAKRERDRESAETYRERKAAILAEFEKGNADNA